MNQKLIFKQAVGRRKSSIAKVQITSGTGKFIINSQPAFAYLQKNRFLVLSMQSPFNLLDLQNTHDTIIQVKGGGLSGQAAAIQLAVSRALCQFEEVYRPVLKQKGFLTCDSRIKERKKYGLKKARKAPQFSKR